MLFILLSYIMYIYSFQCCYSRYRSVLVYNNDDNDISSNTPYVDALFNSVGLIKHRYFFPGHNGGKGAPYSIVKLLDKALHYDLPELDELDNIHSPEGPLLKSLELAKALYGSYRSWYLVNGSTSGILSAILACFRIHQRYSSNKDTKRVFLLGRDSHKSAFDALSLAGVDGVLLPCNYDEKFQIPLGVSIDSITEAIKLHDGSICGLLITRPSYQGVSCDTKILKEIVLLCNSKGIPVVVDEAHGAHLRFLGIDSMQDAMNCGADISVQSSHKTLTSLSQTGMMHVNKNAFSYLDSASIRGCELGSEVLQECFSMLTTTSPNSLFLASLDATRGQFEKEGNIILQKAMDAINDIKEAIRTKGKISLLDDSENVKTLKLLIDPLKLTIQVDNNESLNVDDIMCEEEGIYCELINKKYISYALSPCSTYDTLKVLKDSLIRHNYGSFDRKPGNDRKPLNNYNDAPTGLAYLNVVKVAQSLPISIPLGLSIGKTSIETICVYPPGIPLLIKGETITKEHVNALTSLKSTFKSNIKDEDNDFIDTGSSVTGWSDTNFETIKVINE